MQKYQSNTNNQHETNTLQIPSPKYAFTVKSHKGWKTWRERLLSAIEQRTGLTNCREFAGEIAPEYDSPVELPDHIRQRVTIQTAPDYRVPLWLLCPKQNGPFIPIIALHGHGRGRDEVAGVYHNEEQYTRIRRLNYDYGLEAVRNGFLVAIPDQRGFGELSTGGDCRDQAKWAFHYGTSLIGLQIWDNMRVLSWLLSHPDSRTGTAGCIGLSGGGGAAMWLSAIDQRIGCAIVSSHLADSKEGCLGCIHNVVPGLLQLAERSDIAGLIAPRPLLVESGLNDNGCPRTAMDTAFSRLERIWDSAGVPEKIAIDRHKGGHEWSGRLAWEWLRKWL
jgi:hypothetical protein